MEIHELLLLLNFELDVRFSDEISQWYDHKTKKCRIYITKDTKIEDISEIIFGAGVSFFQSQLKLMLGIY